MRRQYHKLFLICVTIVTFLIYSQGINGPFIYDDESSLSRLGLNGGIDTINEAINFIVSNHTGPTGRPVSMASFLLNSTNWPAESTYFKLTNILIHLLCGWLIYTFIYKLLSLSNNKNLQHRAQLIALLTSVFWLLHPLHVSTTLYTIQRMTQLSTFFSLLTLLAYLHFISTLSKSSRLKDFIFPTLLILIFMILGILSKENAILIFPAILCINWFIQPTSRSQLFKLWQYSITYIPTAMVLVYFFINHQIFTAGYEFKQFGMFERILTETRVISDYLLQILVPNVKSMSVFHDDLLVSNSIYNPISTLWSTLFIILLVITLFTKIPKIYKFSIIWFFIWHLLESTILPLDLYFEHRNYLASLGPLLALAMIILDLSSKVTNSKLFSPFKVTISLAVIFSLYLLIGLVTLTKFWDSEEKMYIHWLSGHESSKATFMSLIQFYEKTRQLELAHSLTLKGVEYPHFKQDLGIHLKLYTQQCVLRKNQSDSLEHLYAIAQEPTNYNQTVLPLYASLVLTILNGNCKPQNNLLLHKIIDNISVVAPQRKNVQWNSDVLSKQGYLYLYFGEIEKGVSILERAYLYDKPDIAFAIIDNSIKLSNFTKAEHWIKVARRHNELRKTGTIDNRIILNKLYNRMVTQKESIKYQNQ